MLNFSEKSVFTPSGLCERIDRHCESMKSSDRGVSEHDIKVKKLHQKISYIFYTTAYYAAIPVITMPIALTLYAVGKIAAAPFKIYREIFCTKDHSEEWQDIIENYCYENEAEYEKCSETCRQGYFHRGNPHFRSLSRGKKRYFNTYEECLKPVLSKIPPYKLNAHNLTNQSTDPKRIWIAPFTGHIKGNLYRYIKPINQYTDNLGRNSYFPGTSADEMNRAFSENKKSIVLALTVREGPYEGKRNPISFPCKLKSEGLTMVHHKVDSFFFILFRIPPKLPPLVLNEIGAVFTAIKEENQADSSQEKSA